jgi:hypothetical protein
VIGYAADDVAKPSLRVDVIQASGLDEGVYDSGAAAAFIRRDVMMPGVWVARLSSPIRSIRYSGSPPLLSPIRCMAAAVI